MMKTFSLLLATVLTALSILSPASAATKVFLLGGQSNMAGVGGYSGYIGDGVYPWSDPALAPYYHGAENPLCPEPYNTPLTAVKFWNYFQNSVGADLVNHAGVGNGWTALQKGYGHRNDQFGPELSFGAKLHEMYPNDEIYLVKYAYSSTSLGGDWNPNGSGAMFNSFQARVNAAMTNLRLANKNPMIEGMIWMQGEDDATIGPYAQTYASNLSSLIAKVRTFSGAGPNTKFVAGRITPDVGLWATPQNLAAVRNAQWNISSYVSNASCVNTDDLEKAYYEHYGTQGQIDLGIRFANEFAPVPEPSTLALICTAVFGLLGYVWRKRKQWR